jgi:hypothetical protein
VQPARGSVVHSSRSLACGGIGPGKSTACKLLVSELDCAAHIEVLQWGGSRATNAATGTTIHRNEWTTFSSVISLSLFLPIYPLDADSVRIPYIDRVVKQSKMLPEDFAAKTLSIAMVKSTGEAVPSSL